MFIWAITIFFIVCLLLVFLTCHPVKRLWNPLVPGHCYDVRPIVVTTLALRVFWEFAILILPFRTIWKMQMGSRKKKTVFMIFCAGFLYVDVFQFDVFSADFG